MIFYKIRHIKSGLFFRPASIAPRKLDKFGKTYQRKPSLKMIESNHLGQVILKHDKEIKTYHISDFEIVTFTANEN